MHGEHFNVELNLKSCNVVNDVTRFFQNTHGEESFCSFLVVGSTIDVHWVVILISRYEELTVEILISFNGIQFPD